MKIYTKYIFTGNSSMKKFCGSDKPVVISRSNVLHVIFVSDNVVETMGMNFSYVAGTCVHQFETKYL